MIVGIGTDIVNIERIEHIYSKFGNDFVYKNFHKLEIAYITSLTHAAKIGYLAKRFAAKEAVAKALGIGIGCGLAFKDIAVVNNGAGVPQVLISEAIYPSINEYNIHISLSDDYPFAVAFVTVSK